MNKQGEKSYSYSVGVFLGTVIFGSAGAVIRGQENIPSQGSALIVSNHQSFLDPMFVAQTTKRQIHYMAKEELFRASTSRHMMLGLGAFPVNRTGPTKKTLAHVLKLLREGRVVCLFAEGTRSKDGSLQEFQGGFARLAKKTQTPVIPVGLSGSRELFEDIQGPALPIWRKLIGKAPPRLTVGKPISPELSVAEISAQTHQAVREILEEA